MKIYIGEFEGNHWAVESDPNVKFGRADHWNTESEKEEQGAYEAWRAYLTSLPRILCSDSLVRGLKVGDQLPEHQQRYEVYDDKDICEWHIVSKEYYDKQPEHLRRIMLVPVEANQEQERLYECENCGWSGTEVKTIRLEDRCPQCNSVELEPKPQSQGEDELWTEVAKEVVRVMDEWCGRFMLRPTIDALKSKYTITRKG